MLAAIRIGQGFTFYRSCHSNYAALRSGSASTLEGVSWTKYRKNWGETQRALRRTTFTRLFLRRPVPRVVDRG